MTKMTIPQIRTRLHELGDLHQIDELHDLATDTHRNSPVTRAKASSAKLTASLAAQIRAYQTKNPKMHQREIAHKFNVNPGRVSEALNNLI